MKQFRRGLVFKAHRRVHHSTLGWRAIKKKRECLGLVVYRVPPAVRRAGIELACLTVMVEGSGVAGLGLRFRVWGLGFRVWGLGLRVYGLWFRVWG